MFHGKKLVGGMALDGGEDASGGRGKQETLLLSESPSPKMRIRLSKIARERIFFIHGNLLFTTQVFVIKARL